MRQCLSDKVREFIDGVVSLDPVMQELLTHGGCYRFARLLKLVFPEAKLYRLSLTRSDPPTHVVAKIDGDYWDARGRIDPVEVNVFYPRLIRKNDSWIDYMEAWSYSDNKGDGNHDE